MNVVVSNQADGDGRVRVSLAELIALRARVARLRLPPQDSRATRVGTHSSRLYGRGMDYAESRAYQPGDDVRRLDWRLTARSGRLHTKLFQEEREGQLLILLDHHPGMRFGTQVRFKSVQAARAAAMAAWYAVKAGERVGLMAFGENSYLQRPRGGWRGALDLCGALLKVDESVPGHAEPLSEALAQVTKLQHGANRVLLISDGQSSDEAAQRRLIEMMRHTAIRILIVADAVELHPMPSGTYPIEHAGVRRQLVLQSQRQREDFQRNLAVDHLRLATMAASLGIPHRVIDTAVDPLDAISTLLRDTGGRR